MLNRKLHSSGPRQTALRAAAALLLVLRLPAESQANDGDVSGVPLTSPNPGELFITWDAPGNAPDEYRVTWKESTAKWPSHKDENTEAASAQHRRPRALIGRRIATQGNMTRTCAMIRGLPILLAASAALFLLLAGAPVAAHDAFVPARPTGLTAAGFHGGIALDHEIVSPYVRLDWNDPGDTGITHYLVLRRDGGTHENGRYIVIDSDTGSAQVQYLDHTVENNRRYVYRIIAVNDHGESRPSGPARADTYLVPIVPFPRPDDASPEG